MDIGMPPFFGTTPGEVYALPIGRAITRPGSGVSVKMSAWAWMARGKAH